MTTRDFVFLMLGMGSLFIVTTVSQVQSRTDRETHAVLRARRIELMDERGTVRGSLIVETNGEAMFRLRDKNGTIRVKIGASEDGSGLLLLDHQTEPGVHFLTGQRGTTLKVKGRDIAAN